MHLRYHIPGIWYEVSRFHSSSRLRMPACMQRINKARAMFGTHDTYQHESLSVRLPSLVGCSRHASSRFTCMYRFNTYQDVRAWMLNASGQTLAQLHAPIQPPCMIQRLDTLRIWCNRNLRGMNRCRSAYPLLWVSSGRTLADLHACIDCKSFQMHIRA